MFRQTTAILLIISMVLSLFILTGCQNDAQNTALIGTAAGAGIGQLAGRSTEATLIGAAVGGGIGYILGNESDKAKTADEMAKMRSEMNTVTVHVTNSNGSIIAVRLQKSGPGYIGPRGEYYPTLPTSEQLRPIYGF